MQHLNNLVHNCDVPEAQKRLNAEALWLGDAQAFLHKDQVSAYEMRNFELVDLHDPDYGIRWDSISDVSYDLQEKYFNVSRADSPAGA
jgi:hypothetical protein